MHLVPVACLTQVSSNKRTIEKYNTRAGKVKERALEHEVI
jgi:hypothetical protein